MGDNIAYLARKSPVADVAAMANICYNNYASHFQLQLNTCVHHYVVWSRVSQAHKVSKLSMLFADGLH